MLNSDLFQNDNLPYQPLSPAAYDAAHASLVRLNFPENAILNDYSFSARSRGRIIKINALIFAHPVHRNPAEYASFTLYNAVNGLSDDKIVPVLAESAAPFHLIHRDNHFTFWASAFRNNKLEPIHVRSDIAYDQLDEVLNNYSVDLQPQRIVDVKQGRDIFTLPIFRDIYPLQLSFWAADVTRDLLVHYFGNAVAELRDKIPFVRNKLKTNEVDDITDLAIQLLGATILADTGVLGEHIRLEGSQISLSKVIFEASSKFPRYFKLDLFARYSQQAEIAYQIIRQIRYSSFMPDMLRSLYLEAYSEEERKASGSFDTPLYLTRQIWKNIPVEYLSPDQRVIADVTCGWGSFLIAGHERLSHLDEMQNISLRDFLRGNDKYRFTAKLAGLGLLLSTSEDSWYIDNEDAMQWNWLATSQPNIIVGNPPFQANRKESLTHEQKRYQKADAFLKYAIERLAPGGYLAMVMPRSFTVAESSPQLRKQLLETCSVFELWELPSRVFSGANSRAMVIFAQKKPENQSMLYSVRTRTIQPATLKDFQISGKFTASGLVFDQTAWNENAHKSEFSENMHIMEYKLILTDQIWQKILSQCVELQAYADIFRGATVGNEGKAIENLERKMAKRNLKEYDEPKEVPWLPQAKTILKRPFFIDYKRSTTITYPNDLQWPRLKKRQIFESTKVLVVYAQDPSWGRRAKVAIEREKYYVSDSFWVVSPLPKAQKLNITNEVLAAIISWDVSNAWIIEHMKSPAIPKRVMDTIPFPKNLSQDDCQALTEAVLKLEASAEAKVAAPLEATQTIDTILKAAYHLDDATFERLRKISEWDQNPLITLDPIPDTDNTNWILSGVVDSVNAEEGTITLWMEGFEELQTVQIAPSMPGWMLRPGAAFCTKIPRDYVTVGLIRPDSIDWGVFRPQPYTYMSEEELFAELSHILQEDDRNRIG